MLDHTLKSYISRENVRPENLSSKKTRNIIHKLIGRRAPAKRDIASMFESAGNGIMTFDESRNLGDKVRKIQKTIDLAKRGPIGHFTNYIRGNKPLNNVVLEDDPYRYVMWPESYNTPIKDKLLEVLNPYKESVETCNRCEGSNKYTGLLSLSRTIKEYGLCRKCMTEYMPTSKYFSQHGDKKNLINKL